MTFEEDIALIENSKVGFRVLAAHRRLVMRSCGFCPYCEDDADFCGYNFKTNKCPEYDSLDLDCDFCTH